MTSSLKKKTSFALFWSFIDKGGQQFLQLAFGIVLARILLTDDFGTFALLAIFTAMANILQESGFASALIRKTNPDKADFASVFYFNTCISIIIYIGFFFATPLLSNFYDKPVLSALARVTFLSFVFNSFGIIQNVILVRKMDFKTNTKATLISSLLAGLVSIALALQGYGVWALVAQLVVQSFVRSVLLWIFVRWRPETGFSFVHIKAMTSYSSKLLVTSLMNQFCVNIYSNVIGKCFSSHLVGVYNQANKFSTIPQSVISDGIKTATFPALAKIKDDDQYLKKAYRKIIRITAFISFPIALAIIITAKPIILILITEKWEQAIPLLQIFAIGGAFYPLYSLVATLLQTIGKSGLILKLETFRNLMAMSILFFTTQLGVTEIVMGFSFVNIAIFFVGMLVAGRHINYKLIEIAKDIAPFVLIACFCFIPFGFIEYLGVSNLWLLLLLPSLIGAMLYLSILKLAGSVIIDDAIQFLKDMLKKNQEK